MDFDELIAWLLASLAWLWAGATWFWGVATEDISMQMVNKVANWLKPWRWPVIRAVVARYREIGVAWKGQYMAQSQTWRILIGFQIAGILVVFSSVALHTFTVGGDFGLLMVGWYCTVCGAVVAFQLASAVQLVRERLIPLVKARLS